MQLLLIRHALAAEQDPDKYPDDSTRPLVPKGKRIHRRMASRLFDAGLIPSRIFSSPWKRAWQTARITFEETGLSKADRLPCATLATAPNLAAIAAEIGDPGPGERIALVGHEPWMSELASLLLTGENGGMAIDFPKSGIMGIEAEEFAAGKGALVFFWRP